MVFSRQVQGIVYILLMQFMTKDLSASELRKGTGCNETNQKANDFTPQDWTGKREIVNCAILHLNTGQVRGK